MPFTPTLSFPASSSVTNGIIWPQRPTIKISLDSFNGFSRSDLPPETRSSQRSNAESPPGADKIRLQNLHSRPSYALFQHLRPFYAIFGSALAQPFERKISLSRPTYGVFGGQELPLVTQIAAIDSHFPIRYYNSNVTLLLLIESYL